MLHAFQMQLQHGTAKEIALQEAQLHWELGHNRDKVVALIRTARFHSREMTKYKRMARESAAECLSGIDGCTHASAQSEN